VGGRENNDRGVYKEREKRREEKRREEREEKRREGRTALGHFIST